MSRPPLPTGEPLVGSSVRLALLTEQDLPELARVLSDPRVYGSGYVMHRRPVEPADGVALARERWLAGQGVARWAYGVRLVGGGALVGTTSLLDAEPAHERLHLGSTLYDPEHWGTRVNPECKLLLLDHCFALGYGRVKIQTDALNTRSRGAIAKLGAQREGVLRRHTRREDGTFRDTVVFSVIREEWPRVRAGLQERLRP